MAIGCYFAQKVVESSQSEENSSMAASEITGSDPKKNAGNRVGVGVYVADVLLKFHMILGRWKPLWKSKIEDFSLKNRHMF